VQYMPQWIQWCAVVNPINYAVEAARNMLVGKGDWAAFGPGYAIVLGFAIAAFLWANFVFMRGRR